MPESVGTVAIVPARGGSKRIPRKNIRPFRGIPLLARTLDMVRSAGVFDRVVVSTDDDEIAAVAVEAGGEVPFRRPASLADDHTGTRPVVQHALGLIEDEQGFPVRTACVVYPAAVFVKPSDLVRAHRELVQGEADFVFAAAAFPAPVQRALRRLPGGRCEMMWPEHATTRSQDLPSAFHDVGQFYWGRRDAWFSQTPIFEARSLMHELPHWRVQDIDTPDDWTRAELLHRMLDEL